MFGEGFKDTFTSYAGQADPIVCIHRTRLVDQDDNVLGSGGCVREPGALAWIKSGAVHTRILYRPINLVSL